MIEFMRTTSPDLYLILNGTGTFLFFLTCIFQIRKVKAISGRFGKKLINLTESKNIKFPTATIVAIIEICIYVFINYLFATNYTHWFGKMLDMGPNYFGIIMIGPFIFAVVCFILGIDIVKAYDIQGPAFAIGLTVSKIGCFCSGCCRGMKWENGLYNYQSKLVEFPVQLVEAGLAFLIFIILISIRKKAKEGTLFPLYIILYSGTRFFSEFTRHEPEVLGGLKLYHWCCIAGVVFGIILLLIAIFFGDKISRLFTMEIRMPKNISAEISYDYHQFKNKLFRKNNKVVHHKKKRKK